MMATMMPSDAADAVDDYISSQMPKNHVTGLSLAIIEGGKIVRAQGYGFADKSLGIKVTPHTLFQAGSISKSVAALGALHLVEAGKLSLDANINTYLTTWKLPENEFTNQKPVTLREILSHTAGITVHGFPGYEAGSPVPTLVQVLNGEKPANTPAIRVDTLPGSIWRYSGGGYTIMQQMILDVTEKAFPDFMQETVLKPFGMTDSSYQQPMPDTRISSAAIGYYSDGAAVKGRWHIYPEMAAAGLWTTPSDLARFAIGVQESFKGTTNAVISQNLTREMLTDQKNGDGLGLFLQGTGKTLRFTHDGRDECFDASMMAYEQAGQGAVIMINANVEGSFVPHLLEVIAREYQWPGYPMSVSYSPIQDKEPAIAATLKSELAQMAAGKYNKDLYTPQLSAIIEAQMKAGLPAIVSGFGALQSIELLERSNNSGNRFYRYRLTFKNTTLLAPCTFDKDNKISGLSFQQE